MKGIKTIMKDYLNIFICFCFLTSCNSTIQGDYSQYDFSQGGPVPLRIESEENMSSKNVKCLAENLSFLIGQPETALAAMEYPADTRVLSESQELTIDKVSSSRLNLVIGSDRRIVNVFCG